MNPRISVILPIYNQSSHLDFLFEQYTTRLPQLNVTWELLFIVNGSRDDSYNKAQSLANGNPNVIVHNLQLGGWGRAVKFGIAQAKGELVCYTNSARTAIDDLILVLTYALSSDKTVIKTSRIVRESFIRKIGSIVYNYENRKLLGTPIWDVNGTPKVINYKYLKNIELISDDDLIDAEIMAKIYRSQVQIVEILIVSTKRLGGRSTTSFKSAWKMYTGLFKLSKLI